MREKFGPRGALHVYPLIEVITKAIRYMLYMATFFLALAYSWGQRFKFLVNFRVFDKTKLKNKQTELHKDIHIYGNSHI